VEEVYLVHVVGVWTNDLDSIYTNDYFCGHFHRPGQIAKVWRLKRDVKLSAAHVSRSLLPNLLAQKVDAAVINAGDGTHEHPTQALLDALTIRRRKGRLEGLVVAICGDVLHSRVARSNIHLLSAMGSRVRVVGPPTLIPRDVEALGCAVEYSLDRLGEADVVYALRMQHERMTDSFVPSLREYAARYQIDGRRLGPRQVLMHPGPVNRGVELAAEVIDSPQAIIGQQVAAGVVVRMAVLYELLAGRGAPQGEAVVSEPTPQLA
jgi:aspartate carbamoyltransferase catalytic subunit